MLRRLLVLFHRPAPGHHRRLKVQGIHSQGGPQDHLETRIQRGHTGCRRAHGQHVRHRVRAQGGKGEVSGQEMPGLQAVPQPATGPRPADLPPERDRRDPGSQEGFRQLRHPLRHDRRRQRARTGLPRRYRRPSRLRPDEGCSRARLAQGAETNGEAGARGPREVPLDVLRIRGQMRKGRIPDVLLHGGPPRMHGRRHEGALRILPHQAAHTPRTGAGVHPDPVLLLHRDVLHFDGLEGQGSPR